MAPAILPASGIYAIVNTATGKRYIGSACNIAARWRFHRSMLANNRHHSRKLQHSWTKHGAGVFEFSVIEYVADKSLLILREQVWIDYFESATDAGYNVLPTAGSHFGVKQSEAHIASRVRAHQGAKRSIETRERIAAAARGRKQSPEQVANRIAHIVGKKQTREHIEKASIARIGRKNTPESIERMRAVVKTPEARANMSAAAKGKKLSPESIAKREATKRANRLARQQS